MNTAESDYVQLIASHLIKRDFDVAVLNHLGCLPGETLHAPRLFTYGKFVYVLLLVFSLAFPDYGLQSMGIKAS